MTACGSVFIFSLIPFLLVIPGHGSPLANPPHAKRWRFTFAVHWQVLCSLYISGAYLYTDCGSMRSRATILIPIWGFIFRANFIGEPITRARWLAMVLALGGKGHVVFPRRKLGFLFRAAWRTGWR